MLSYSSSHMYTWGCLMSTKRAFRITVASRPPRFGFSDHITLKLQEVYINYWLKASDMITKQQHTSEPRDTENMSVRLCNHDIVLAQHQQPDGRLAISIRQSVIAHVKLIRCSPRCSLSFSYHPLPLRISLRARPLRRILREPGGIQSCFSVCVCKLVCVRSLSDHQSWGASLELLALIKTSWNEPETWQIHTALIETRLRMFQH